MALSEGPIFPKVMAKFEGKVPGLFTNPAPLPPASSFSYPAAPVFGPWFKPPNVVGGWHSMSSTAIRTGIATHPVLPRKFYDEIRIANTAHVAFFNDNQGYPNLDGPSPYEDGWKFRYARCWYDPKETWAEMFAITKAALINDDQQMIADYINKTIAFCLEEMEAHTYDLRESNRLQVPLPIG